MTRTAPILCAALALAAQLSATGAGAGDMPFLSLPKPLPAKPATPYSTHYALGHEAMIELFSVAPPPCAAPARHGGGSGAFAPVGAVTGAPCKSAGSPVLGAPPPAPRGGPSLR